MSSGGNAPGQMQADPNAITPADMVDTPYGSVNRNGNGTWNNWGRGYGGEDFGKTYPTPQPYQGMTLFGGGGGYQQPRWGGSMGYGGYSPYMGGYVMGGYGGGFGGGFGGFGGGYGMGGYGGGFGSPFGMGGFGGGYGMGGYGMGGFGRPFNLGGGQYSPYMGGYGMGGYPPSSWYAQQNHAQANGGTNLLPINESGHPIFGTTFS